jgi:hypothetical protein
MLLAGGAHEPTAWIELPTDDADLVMVGRRACWWS